MNIHANFIGGNIRVLKMEGADVYMQNEIRDTTEDWFYWAFCVEGAQGQTLHFHLDKKWIGYYGPAISRDFVNAPERKGLIEKILTEEGGAPVQFEAVLEGAVNQQQVNKQKKDEDLLIDILGRDKVQIDND